MQLNPYLVFDGDCREAFEFYAGLLHGEIAMMMTFADAPPGMGEPSRESLGKIMHARLQFGDEALLGSDACPPQYAYEGIKGSSVSLSIDSVADAERIYAALSDGATVQMPLQETFWAQRFAMLVDRFGVPWMINCVKVG